MNEYAELDDYQQLALATDQVLLELPKEVRPKEDLLKLVPLLGMAGEVGALVAEYKKYLRDGPSHPGFEAQVAEELGDILWYLSNTASRFGISLGDIAAENLHKTQSRWAPADRSDDTYELLDEELSPREQIPRQFEVSIADVADDESGGFRVELQIDGDPAGDHLKDNAATEDLYRFHDVFHLTHAALLGWSPVVRGKLMDKKRRSNPALNETEDGGRAIVIEEAVVAYTWGYAKDHAFLEGVSTIDSRILATVAQLTADLEVSSRKLYEWEEAILRGYEVFRAVSAARNGRLSVDLVAREITFSPG